MAEIPTKVIIDCSTGEEQILPLTEDEIAQQEIDKAAYEANKAAEALEATRIQGLKDSAKAKLIAGEPLTSEEAELITI